MINCFWHKPPEAEGDMQTDDDNASPEEYRGNWNASAVVVDEEENNEE